MSGPTMGLLAALSAVICQPGAAAAQISAAKKIYGELARLPAPERGKRIEVGARAEGKLVIIHTMRGSLWIDHVDLLQKRYPLLRDELEGDIGSHAAAGSLYTAGTARRRDTDG